MVFWCQKRERRECRWPRQGRRLEMHDDTAFNFGCTDIIQSECAVRATWCNNGSFSGIELESSNGFDGGLEGEEIDDVLQWKEQCHPKLIWNNWDKLFQDNINTETYLVSSQILRVFEAAANRRSDRWWSTALWKFRCRRVLTSMLIKVINLGAHLKAVFPGKILRGFGCVNMQTSQKL